MRLCGSQMHHPMAIGARLVTELREVLFTSALNYLLLSLPMAFVAKILDWGDSLTFVFSMLALIPLAERLGFVTEQLAMYTNNTLGGLLNATFGNATEVIISAFALQKGYLRVVQLSLLGSVVSNLLLVLGSAFIAGGIANSTQTYNQQGISINCGLLILACVVIILPSLLDTTDQGLQSDDDLHTQEVDLSRFESCFMLVCYGLFLFFQLYTHRHLYEEVESDDQEKANLTDHPVAQISMTGAGLASANCHQEDQALVEVEMAHTTHTSQMHASDMEAGLPQSILPQDSLLSAAGTSSLMPAAFMKSSEVNTVEAGGDGDDDEEKVLSWIGCFVWLTIITVLIAFLSEFIMDGIIGASTQLHVPLPFLSTIVLPIVGNAAEHASAVVFAYKNKIEISLGVAVGSATQIAVLVVPMCVVLSWIMGEPLSLDFNSFETVTLFISVLLTIVVIQDGHSNWLKGLMLVLTYFFVAAGFWCHKDGRLQIEQAMGR